MVDTNAHQDVGHRQMVECHEQKVDRGREHLHFMFQPQPLRRTSGQIRHLIRPAPDAASSATRSGTVRID